MASANAGKGLVGLFKRGWHEFPEGVASGVVGILGIALIINAVRMYSANDGDNRKYKAKYTVYRHDDPRVAKIKQ